MFDMYDVVISKEKLSDNIPKGTLGTVLLVYGCNNEYEVEFVDDNLSTLDILTVSGEKILLRKQ